MRVKLLNETLINQLKNIVFWIIFSSFTTTKEKMNIIFRNVVILKIDRRAMNTFMKV